MIKGLAFPATELRAERELASPSRNLPRHSIALPGSGDKADNCPKQIRGRKECAGRGFLEPKNAQVPGLAGRHLPAGGQRGVSRRLRTDSFHGGCVFLLCRICRRHPAGLALPHQPHPVRSRDIVSCSPRAGILLFRPDRFRWTRADRPRSRGLSAAAKLYCLLCLSRTRPGFPGDPAAAGAAVLRIGVCRHHLPS